MHKVTILSKPDCTLCKQAVKVVQNVVGAHIPVLIEEVDITQDPELLAQYKNDVPVILVDDKEQFRGVIDPQKLARFFMDEPGENLLGIS